MKKKGFYRVTDVMKLLEMARPTVINLCKSGDLPGSFQPRKNRGVWLIPAEAVRNMLGGVTNDKT